MYHTSIKWELSHDHAGTFKFDLRLLLFELRRFKQVSLISWQSLSTDFCTCFSANERISCDLLVLTMAWTKSLRPFLQAIQKGVAPSANRPGLNGLELLLMRNLHTSTVSATEMKCWNKITIILGAARKWKSTPGTFLHRNDLKKWIKQTITQEQGSIKSWMDRTRKRENFTGGTKNKDGPILSHFLPFWNLIVYFYAFASKLHF